jgi:hypothetical protein
MINKNFLADFVGNKIFNVEFIKKNGAIRTMNARLNVQNNLKGSGVRKPDHLITVFDMNAGAYRSFDKSSVLSVKCNGITFNIEK